MIDDHENEDKREAEQHAPDEEPSTDELEEPSVSKEPGEEPRAPEQKDEEPSHRAVGIGVIDDEASPANP